ncbi:VUT family protein [bacterium]|nr:VUT family protein [bacterium]
MRVFHFWKKLTKGKYLWLRNNASTFTSQLVGDFRCLWMCLLGLLPKCTKELKMAKLGLPLSVVFMLYAIL